MVGRPAFVAVEVVVAAAAVISVVAVINAAANPRPVAAVAQSRAEEMGEMRVPQQVGAIHYNISRTRVATVPECTAHSPMNVMDSCEEL
jgi:hypothetical protein